MSAETKVLNGTRPLLAIAASCLILAIAAVLSVAVWDADRLSPGAAKTVAIAFFLFAAPFLVLVHELGHLGAAVALGWRVPILSVGAFTLRFSPLRFSAGAPAFGPNTAGAVFAVPPAGGGSRAGWIAVYAGGPAANLLFAAIAASFGFAASRGSTANAMFLAVAAISLVSGIFNLVPFRGRSGGNSDGLQILSTLFAANMASRGRHVRLLAQMLDGKRPRDWDAALVGAVEADSIWRNDAQGQLLAYAWHLDRGETAKARSALRRAGECRHLPDAVFVEQAFLLAFLDASPGEARLVLAKAQSWSVRQTPAYWRAQAATCAGEGDTSGAREAIRKWTIACADWPYTTQDERDWLDAVALRAAAIAGQPPQ